MGKKDAPTLHAAIARTIVDAIKDALGGGDDLWDAIDSSVQDEMRTEGTYARLCPHGDGFENLVLLHIAGDGDGHEVTLHIPPIETDMSDDSLVYEIAAYRRLAAELLEHAATAEAARTEQDQTANGQNIGQSGGGESG